MKLFRKKPSGKHSTMKHSQCKSFSPSTDAENYEAETADTLPWPCSPPPYDDAKTVKVLEDLFPSVCLGEPAIQPYTNSLPVESVFLTSPDTNHSKPTMSPDTNHSKPTMSLRTPLKPSRAAKQRVINVKVVKVFRKTAVASVISDLTSCAGRAPLKQTTNGQQNVLVTGVLKTGRKTCLILKDSTNGNRLNTAARVANVTASKENTLQTRPVVITGPLIVHNTDPAVYTTEIQTTARPESGFEMANSEYLNPASEIQTTARPESGLEMVNSEDLDLSPFYQQGWGTEEEQYEEILKNAVINPNVRLSDAWVDDRREEVTCSPRASPTEAEASSHRDHTYSDSPPLPSPSSLGRWTFSDESQDAYFEESDKMVSNDGSQMPSMYNHSPQQQALGNESTPSKGILLGYPDSLLDTFAFSCPPLGDAEPLQEEPSGHEVERAPETNNNKGKIKSTTARKPAAKKSLRRKNVASGCEAPQEAAPQEAATQENVASSSTPKRKNGGRQFSDLERVVHNRKEKERRGVLVECVNELRKLLRLDSKCSKEAVLIRAKAEIDYLNYEDLLLQSEKEIWQNKNKKLALKLKEEISKLLADEYKASRTKKRKPKASTRRWPKSK